MLIDWKDTTISAPATIREAMTVIDHSAKQIALVIDEGGHLLGTITDGDIRRGILRGLELSADIKEVMNCNPTTGLIDEAPTIWQRTMQRYSLMHLPLLDAAGDLVGLARYELPSEPKRENQVILMAGGLGSRLHPLTKETPKPLLKIGSKPILETIIENFAAQGFRKFTLSLNYKGDMIERHFGSGEAWDVEINYIRETKRMGTAGALSLLPERPQHPFIVMNGDLLTKVDFVRLIEFHQRKEFNATMCTREFDYQVPYGVLELDGHRINGLKEKPIQRYSINAGIYALNPDLLDMIPENDYFDMTQLFNELIDRDRPVGSFPLKEYWIDIGQMEDFERAGFEFDEHFSEI